MPNTSTATMTALSSSIHPRVRHGAGARPTSAAMQASAPALGPTSRLLAASCAHVHPENRRSRLSSSALANTPNSCPIQK